MPRTPTYEWFEKTVREKYVREKSFESHTWNSLVREVKLIAYRQNLILKRLEAYEERLHDIEQEVCIASNAANNGAEEIVGVKKARDILKFKVLATFDFMDDRVEAKLGIIRERINKIE